MKTLTAFLLLISAFLLPIKAQQFPNKTPISLNKQVSNIVQFEGFANEHQLSGRVDVYFTVDDLHLINLVRITSNQPQLASHVRKQLLNKEVFGQNLVIGQLMHMSFCFQYEGYIGPQVGMNSPSSEVGPEQSPTPSWLENENDYSHSTP